MKTKIVLISPPKALFLISPLQWSQPQVPRAQFNLESSEYRVCAGYPLDPDIGYSMLHLAGGYWWPYTQGGFGGKLHISQLRISIELEQISGWSTLRLCPTTNLLFPVLTMDDGNAVVLTRWYQWRWNPGRDHLCRGNSGPRSAPKARLRGLKRGCQGAWEDTRKNKISDGQSIELLEQNFDGKSPRLLQF